MGSSLKPLMTRTIWKDDLDIDRLKRNKKSLRGYRKHEGYKIFKEWAQFLQSIGMEVAEIEEHLLNVDHKCTPLIYGHPSGISSPNGNYSRMSQMRAALEDMYD